MEVVVRSRDGASPGQLPVEVVERKGLGHPDTICDAVAEHVSVSLCRHYLQRFGKILHHNVDKILLCGGSSRPAFGGGEVTQPIEIYLGGRATEDHGGEHIPIHEIAEAACRDWLRAHLRGLDSSRDVRVISKLRPGSSDLIEVFGRSPLSVLANDTSCGAGFSPHTDLERVVLNVENLLNSSDTKAAHPAIGEDIKVMGVRQHQSIRLTIGCALVARHLRDLTDYAQQKEIVRALAVAAARRVTSLEVAACVNAADDLDNGHVFLTVTGTSAEAGDDGQVGRGNRVGGLITPYRPMTLEAAAGKNPVSHVGKLYNLMAYRIAGTLTEALPDVRDATCVLVSAIGHPVSAPQLVDVGLLGAPATPAGVQTRVREIVEAAFADIDTLRDELLRQACPVY